MGRINSRFRLRREKGFTLIEMLVVIAIIAILMAAIVSVGSMVRTNVLRRHTVAELKLLDGVMKDYLADGNPEPDVPASPSPSSHMPQATNWPYTIAGGDYANTANVKVAPDNYSDLTNWVAALQSNPTYARKLATLPSNNDGGGVSASGVSHPVILDAFGFPIRYVSSFSSPTGQGYFMSAGPDGKFSMQTDSTGQPITYGGSNGTQPRADELYSYDAQ